MQPADTLWSIALAGGKGTRLAEGRKRLDPATHPHVPPEAWGTIGPKALASMRAGPAGPVKPMIEWHLDVHAACGRIERIILAAGAGGQPAGPPLPRRRRLLPRPAGRAPGRAVAGRHHRPDRQAARRRPAARAAGRLRQRPTTCSTPTCTAAIGTGWSAPAACGIDAGGCVIDIAALVPWEESGDYGALDLDESSGLVRGFREKAPAERNPFLERAGRRWTPINSGFSIIPNPRRLFARYLDEAIVRTSQALERGELDYAAHEGAVKYESLYERIAARRPHGPPCWPTATGRPGDRGKDPRSRGALAPAALQRRPPSAALRTGAAPGAGSSSRTGQWTRRYKGYR